MRELVTAQLLVVVDIRLLQHLPPHLLGLLLAELALGQQLQGLNQKYIDIEGPFDTSLDHLLNISHSNEFISIEVVDGEGVV